MIEYLKTNPNLIGIIIAIILSVAVVSCCIFFVAIMQYLIGER